MLDTDLFESLISDLPDQKSKKGRKSRAELAQTASDLSETSETGLDRELLTFTEDNVVVKESHRHRMIAYLAAQGKTNKEICELMGYSQSWLSQLLNSAPMRQLIMEELQKAGMNFQEHLKKNAEESMFVLSGLLKSEAEPIRYRAATWYLEKYLGPVGKERQITDDSALTLAEVEQQLEQLKASDRIS